jgi:hypothetical protein
MSLRFILILCSGFRIRFTDYRTNCAATYNYVNCYYFMALSHTFYVIKLF